MSIIFIYGAKFSVSTHVIFNRNVFPLLKADIWAIFFCSICFVDLTHFRLFYHSNFGNTTSAPLHRENQESKTIWSALDKYRTETSTYRCQTVWVICAYFGNLFFLVEITITFFSFALKWVSGLHTWLMSYISIWLQINGIDVSFHGAYNRLLESKRILGSFYKLMDSIVWIRSHELYNNLSIEIICFVPIFIEMRVHETCLYGLYNLKIDQGKEQRQLLHKFKIGFYSNCVGSIKWNRMSCIWIMKWERMPRRDVVETKHTISKSIIATDTYLIFLVFFDCTIRWIS